jgi:hypothetical protein
MAYRAVRGAICEWSHNHCANCQSHVKITTDLWQFAQKTRWQVFADHTMVVQPLHIAAVTVEYSKGLCPICHSCLEVVAES